MCKNLMIVGIKHNKQKELWEFVEQMAPIMSESDDDGLGFSAMTTKGLYGERWLNPKEAFKYRKPWSRQDQAIKDNFAGVLEGDVRYNCFVENKGANLAPVQAILVHARWATCEKNIQNVHPFYRDGTALIHNGVINNVKQLKQIYSTCDSECILNSYVDNGVNKDPNKIAAVGKDLAGYYGCGVLTKNADGLAVMDVFRGPTPNLYAAHIKELDALVFCTRADMVNAACNKLKWDHSNFFTLGENKMLRLNAATGEMMSFHKFEAKTYDYSGSYHSHPGWESWQARRDKEELEEQEKAAKAEREAKEAATAKNLKELAEAGAQGVEVVSAGDMHVTLPESTKETLSDIQARVEEKRATEAEKKRQSQVSLVTAKQQEQKTLEKIATSALSSSDPYLASGITYKH